MMTTTALPLARQRGAAAPWAASTRRSHARRIQAKLRVGAVNDPLEHEADRVADAVMSGALSERVGVHSDAAVRRKCAACEAEDDTLRRSPSAGATASDVSTTASGQSLESTSSRASGNLGDLGLTGGGQPLSSESRAFFEPRFGYDFGRVRIHTGPHAAGTAHALRARAFTTGEQIVFGAGEYAPGTLAGKRLLAHELTHVVQQSGTSGGKAAVISRATDDVIQRDVTGQPPTSFEEFLICLIMCMCELVPNISAIGNQLRQACVSEVLNRIDAQLNGLSTLKAEVSYDMTRPTPEPIMSSSNPRRPASRWGVVWYIRRHMPHFVPGTGMIRRPDVVIESNPLLGPRQGNIRRVVEIKFPGDTMSAAQRAAYERIAGSPSLFTVLTTGPESCNCEELRERLAEALELALELLIISIIIAALVADDATGVGAADDVAIIPLAARLAAVAARLAQLVPRMAPILVPVLQRAAAQ